MPKPTKFNTHAIHPEKFCQYIHRFCNQTRLDGYNYCIRHILEDKSAPFRQCTYVHPINKKRCTNAAPKTDKNEKRHNSLCPWHAKRALQKSKTLLNKKKILGGSAAAFLRDLEHYCSDSKHDPKYTRDIGLTEKYDLSNPYECDIDRSLRSLDSHSKGSIATKLTDPFRCINYDGNYSWMSTLDDPRAHCGVYTSKEILRIAICKAVSLKSLYSERLNKTFEALRDAKLEYLAESKKQSEKKHFGKRYENSIDERIINKDELRQLKALEKYHHPYAVERLLRHLSDMKYGKTKKTYVLCIFIENGKKCNRKSILHSKYCSDHILNDPNQVLFKSCGLGKNSNCNNPVLPVEDGISCEQHLHLTLLEEKATKTMQDIPSAATDPVQEQEHFQSMDDIASLGLDVVIPGSLFGLDQFGDPGESTDTVLSDDQADLMPIQPITLNISSDALCDTRKLECDEDK